MTRFLFAFLMVPAVGAPSFGQDMPLSQIVLAGESWKRAEKPGAKPKPPAPVPPVEGFRAFTAATYTADRGTVFAAAPGERFLWAMPSDAAQKAAPYAPLRAKTRGAAIEVTSLAADKDGRVYAATEIGVQVFDPTGRLCGVLTPAAEGKPEHLTFDGDQLTLWIGNAKYTRKLNTVGAK